MSGDLTLGPLLLEEESPLSTIWDAAADIWTVLIPMTFSSGACMSFSLYVFLCVCRNLEWDYVTGLRQEWFNGQSTSEIKEAVQGYKLRRQFKVKSERQSGYMFLDSSF